MDVFIKGTAVEVMLQITWRVHTELQDESQTIGVLVVSRQFPPGTEYFHQLPQCICENLVVSSESFRWLRIATNGTIILWRLDAQPNVLDHGLPTLNHLAEIFDARVAQNELTEVSVLKIRLPFPANSSANSFACLRVH